MSRISAGQTAEDCYEMLTYFEDKLESFDNDAILLYTNGLYFNTEDVAFEKRVKMNAQILNHSVHMRSLISRDRKFIPKAIHLMPIDYIILNSEEYVTMFATLKKIETEDSTLRSLIKEDIKEREYTEANINFILEEIVVAHLIREQFVDLPSTLARSDDWRIICYPGKALKSEIYIHQNKFLARNKDCKNEYRGTHYNYKEKVLEVFDEMVV